MVTAADELDVEVSVHDVDSELLEELVLVLVDVEVLRDADVDVVGLYELVELVEVEELELLDDEEEV